MRPFEHPLDGIFVTFDLGISDAMAMWFWRVNGYGVDFIDWFEDTGKALSHYFAQIDARVGLGWKIRKIILPHDAAARSLQTGVSTEQMFVDHYGAAMLDIVPALDVSDGIEATRWLFEQVTRFHPRAAGGLKRLKGYKYKFDEKLKVYSKTPVHDWTSHTADSARYTALYVKRAELLTAADEKPTAKDLSKPIGVTLDEALAASDSEQIERRIG
jgi:phage terminase large subunit